MRRYIRVFCCINDGKLTFSFGMLEIDLEVTGMCPSFPDATRMLAKVGLERSIDP